MATYQMNKTSALEKRFQKLSEQLSGKIRVKHQTLAVSQNDVQTTNKFTFHASSYIPQTVEATSDLVYLKTSLIKISALSILAIGIEGLLYFFGLDFLSKFKLLS